MLCSLVASICLSRPLTATTVEPRVCGSSVDAAWMTLPSLRNGPVRVVGSKSTYCSPTGDRLRTRALVLAGILRSRLVSDTSAWTPSGVSLIEVTLPTLTPR